MKNRILNDILEQRYGHYVHALELPNVEYLKETVSILAEEFSKEYTQLEIIEFFDTIQVNYLPSIGEESEEEENELYNFDISEYILILD